MEHKYKIGDTVTMQIGDRPLLYVTVLECVARNDTPHYKVDWAKAGYHELLNTVALPEKTLSAILPVAV